MAIASFHKFWSNEAISYIAAAETMSPREFSRGMSWFGAFSIIGVSRKISFVLCSRCFAAVSVMSTHRLVH